MPSDRSLLEREMQRLELRPFTLEGFHQRRSRKQRNRRIGTAVVAVALAAAGIGGVAWSFLSGPEPRPTDQPSGRFVGTWTSTEIDFPDGSQTMTIRPAKDGALEIALHDESNGVCSTQFTRVNGIDTPSTLTGTGRLEDATTLVVPSPVLACAEGREPAVTGFPEEQGGISYTMVLDLATDRLFDSLGVAWHRGVNGADTTAETGEDIPPRPVGPGPRALLNGEITLYLDRPWGDHAESYLDPRIFWLIGRPDDAGIEVLANPQPQSSCGNSAGVPASAAELVQAIRSNPDLETTVPVPARVGGIEGVRLDVTPAQGAQTCPFGDNIPVVLVAGREAAWGSINPGDLGRLYVLDIPGGSARALAILITAPEAVFERAVRDAGPVLDSFEFHAP